MLSTDPRRQSQLNEPEEKRTVRIADKPYHWTLNDDGYLSLQPGPTEYEKIRWDVVQLLIDKGMKPNDITAEVIEGIIEAAKGAAIAAAVEEVIDEAQS